MDRQGGMIGRGASLVTRWFPEHRITLHTNGTVRLVRVGTRVQLMGVAAAAFIAGWMGIATVGMVSGVSKSEEIAIKDAELQRMQASVASLRANVVGLRGDVVTAAQKLEQRQRFLASLLTGKGDLQQLAALMPKIGPTIEEAAPEAAAVLAPFAKLEREQLAFVDKATVAAEARYRDTQALLRRLGLDSTRFTAQSTIAIGGPVAPLDAPGAPLANAEPKFKQLFVSWKKVDQLEKAMAAIPSYRPVQRATYTSGFGIRYDPFNGRAAMHAGVDLAGSHGEPIYAAADGVVTTAGWRGAYGNAIDLGHGKGIATRYGHMARVLVRAGDRVKKGEMIGHMGSTGRSTGTHLHYEVRVDGRAVNPLPFLEASNYVLAVQNRAEGQGGPEIAAR